MINIFIGIYFMYLGIDVISREISNHTFNKGIRSGKMRPFVIRPIDSFSEIEAIGESTESKDTVQ